MLLIDVCYIALFANSTFESLDEEIPARLKELTRLKKTNWFSAGIIMVMLDITLTPITGLLAVLTVALYTSGMLLLVKPTDDKDNGKDND